MPRCIRLLVAVNLTQSLFKLTNCNKYRTYFLQTCVVYIAFVQMGTKAKRVVNPTLCCSSLLIPLFSLLLYHHIHDVYNLSLKTPFRVSFEYKLNTQLISVYIDTKISLNKPKQTISLSIIKHLFSSFYLCSK